MARSMDEAPVHPFRRQREQAEARACDHPGCREEGLYRAPRSRDRLREYLYFCLEHVRAYNRAWNYFAGMSEAEIEHELRRDACWHRPSWPLASMAQAEPDRGYGYRFSDGFAAFNETSGGGAGRGRQRNGNGRDHGAGWARGRRPQSPEEKALAELDLGAPATFEAIKTRYKELVKRLHPDANGGDRSREDRLKTVNQAYATLRASHAR